MGRPRGAHRHQRTYDRQVGRSLYWRHTYSRQDYRWSDEGYAGEEEQALLQAGSDERAVWLVP